MQPDKNEKKQITNRSTLELYDLYAPAVNGKILSIVHNNQIANKILEDVFVAAYTKKNADGYSSQNPLVSLLNQARIKSYKTVKALIIFRECCSGASICTENKK